MTTTTSAMILVPNLITNNQIVTGTSIPAVDTAKGEVAYAPATAYTVGQQVNHADSIWESVLASTGVTPGTDPKKWLRVGPTNRVAPFDDKISSVATATGSLKYVLKPEFFTGLALYRLQGEHLNIKVYDSDGGTLIEQVDSDLYEQAMGLFEYLFMSLRPLTKYQMDNLPLLPDGRIHVTITSAGAGQVGLGMLVLGFWQSLIGGSSFGGVEYGASMEVKSYSYIKPNDDGSTEIVPRNSANNITCTATIDSEQANNAMSILEDIVSKPVAFVACGMPKYDYLNTFGLVSGDITAESWSSAKININVKGYI